VLHDVFQKRYKKQAFIKPAGLGAIAERHQVGNSPIFFILYRSFIYFYFIFVTKILTDKDK